MSTTPGKKFREALQAEKPLQVAGAINAYAALLAQRAGFRALYLSGAGVANHSYGLPDTGKTELADVLIDARRITQRVDLPLLVDIDTGWDDPARAVREMAAANGEGTTAAPAADVGEAKPLRGPAAALAKAMEESRSIPTATSFRSLAVDTLEDTARLVEWVAEA